MKTSGALKWQFTFESKLSISHPTCISPLSPSFILFAVSPSLNFLLLAFFHSLTPFSHMPLITHSPHCFSSSLLSTSPSPSPPLLLSSHSFSFLSVCLASPSLALSNLLCSGWCIFTSSSLYSSGFGVFNFKCHSSEGINKSGSERKSGGWGDEVWFHFSLFMSSTILGSFIETNEKNINSAVSLSRWGNGG